MRIKSVVFASAVTVFAFSFAGNGLAQTVQTTPAFTLRDGAEAHARGDYASARAIFQSLAERGDVTAQFDLAVMNANGEGGPPNWEEALKWYRAAAEQGDAESFANLATLFEVGSGVPLDYIKAYVLFDAAARLGRGNIAQTARTSRDSVSGKMSNSQLIQAQNLARQCQTENIKACSTRILAGEFYNPGNQALDAPMVVKLEPGGGGTYVAPVVVNGSVALKLQVDSGASDVSIPADVFDALMKSGSVTTSDLLGQKTFTIADGSKVPSQTFRLRSLKLGDVVLENVTASVAPANAPVLLGMSFLGRLKSWSLDNTNHTLTIK